MEKELDLAMSTEYDLIVDRCRTLDRTLYCWIFTGSTGSCGEKEFDFTNDGHSQPYSGATMYVKNNAGTILLQFSTTDGSITLSLGGQLTLKKSAADMCCIRAGEYDYDLYLSSATYPKRAFLRGRIKVQQTYTT